MPLLQPGDVVADKYLIEEELGEGGMGFVYRATTLSSGRPVAIKTLKPGDKPGDSAQAAARFIRELRAVAQLQSPHTLTLFDYGRTPEGVLFMVTEFIDGQDLSRLLGRRVRLTEREVAHVMMQVLRSLQEAHDIGILHRDIKPSNIRIFEYEGDALRAKLLDFGIARSLDSEEARLTRTGAVVGTPRYMAPEQVLGEDLTPASDLFSLGLVAYEAIVGRPARSSRKSLASPSFAPDDPVSPPMRHVIERLVAFDASARFQSAAEAHAALREAFHQFSGDEVPAFVGPPAVPTVDELPPTIPQERAVVAPEPTSHASGDHAELSRPPYRLIAGAAATLVGAVLVAGLVLERSTPAPGPRAPVVSARSVAPLLRTQDAPAPQTRDAGPDALDTEAPVPSWQSRGCRQAPPEFRGDALVDGLGGPVAVRRPRNYDHTVPHPLVIDLMRRFDEPATQLATLADEVAIVLVQTPHDHFGGTADFLDDVERDLQAARDSLCIDERRMFLIARAIGAGGVPCRFPELRAMAVTGHLPTEIFEECGERPIPFLHVAAKDSVIYPFEGGRPKCNDPIYDRDARVSAAEFREAWVRRNECAPDSEKTISVGARECRTWDCQTPFVSCTASGGVRWKGMKRRLGAGCADPNSTFPHARVVWDFFESLDSDAAQPDR